MALKPARTLSLFVLFAAAGISHAADVGWPEATGRLAGERFKAEECVALLKKHGSPAQIDRSRLEYAKAKGDNDALIVGLLTALAQKQQPVSLPGLEAKVQSSTVALAQFCTMVSDLLPPTPEGQRQKGVLDTILKLPIEALLKPLSEAVAAIWNYRNETDALTRGTIRTQLEAARWPDFAEVTAAQ